MATLHRNNTDTTALAAKLNRVVTGAVWYAAYTRGRNPTDATQ
jgi:hypothetical protein